MEKDTKKLQVTTCPTYSDFFERFNEGLHKRMGNVIRPDRAISHAIMVELMQILEEEWLNPQTRGRLQLALEGAFYVVAFTLALRGEENPLIEL